MYAAKLSSTKTRTLKKEESPFETTQHDYGKKITFERTIRSSTGEIESLDPKDERVFELPPPGVTVRNPQEVTKERSFGDTQRGGSPRKSYGRVSYFTMLPQEYTGSKWKDF